MGLLSRKAWRLRKTFLWLVSLFVIGGAFYSWGLLPQWLHRLENISISGGLTSPKQVQTPPIEYKTILAWTTKSGKNKWIPNNLKNLGCRVQNCRVTEDRTLYPEADAIIFHAKDVDEDDIPDESLRSTKLWVLLNHEPPPQTLRHTYSFMASQIDWTISYRHDSSIFAPIYDIRRKSGRNVKEIKVHDDRNLLTWLVSHCKTASNREGFVAELKKHLSVDVWGKCGMRLTLCATNARLSCYNELSKKYKFYLSLENSICKDYITEKVYLALQAGMVPIVFGGANFKQSLPPKSYIDALSFPNVKSLADYIEKVGKNNTLYNGYLAWQKKYEVVERRYKWLCDVCEKLDSPDAKPKDERFNLLNWWFDKSKCRRWRNGTLVDYN